VQSGADVTLIRRLSFGRPRALSFEDAIADALEEQHVHRDVVRGTVRTADASDGTGWYH